MRAGHDLPPVHALRPPVSWLVARREGRKRRVNEEFVDRDCSTGRRVAVQAAARRSLARQLTGFAPADHNTGVPVPRISKEDLKQRLDSGSPPILVDARLKYPYEHSTVRLPGALRYPDATSSLPHDRDIVVYDSDPNELSSSHVAAELIRRGYRVAALKGGITEWLGANLPIETKAAPMMAPPEPGALKG
jgi:rhodanese-related sulfurtransferase